MNERRPHWDDNLIEAVCDLIYTDYDGEDLVCAVIAVVEDWQENVLIPGWQAQWTEIQELRGLLQQADLEIRHLRRALDGTP